jgi:hypothetical protein
MRHFDPHAVRWLPAALLALLAAIPAHARDTAFGGVRFVVPAGYERTDHANRENAIFVLETVSRRRCALSVSSGEAPADTLVRDFAVSWAESVDAKGAVPEPRRGETRGGARYVAGEGRMQVNEATRGNWLRVVVLDAADRQRHVMLAMALSEADLPTCKRDADALLESLRADPGWVPPPAAEASAAGDGPDVAGEGSVEDLTLLNGKATDVELLWCESKKKQRQSCPADTSAGVVFIGRTSFAECEDGKSYWVEDGAIVVDKGCRARFAVRAAAGAGARAERFACESYLKDSVYCELYRIDRGVRIGRVLSRAPCVWNESWGVLLDDLGLNSYVWVANGCRAEFHRW